MARLSFLLLLVLLAYCIVEKQKDTQEFLASPAISPFLARIAKQIFFPCFFCQD